MTSDPQHDNPLDAPTVMPSSDCATTEPGNLATDCLPQLAGYELIRELGRGGMGVVYLARQLSIGRLVALKTIQAAGDDELRKILAAEATIVGKLDHPAIVPVYEACNEGNSWFFSMGLVQGEDLARVLARRVLDAEQVARLGIRMCEALEHAHSQGIVHLDIKPANILLDQHGAPKLTDFGLAAVERCGADENGIIGTPQFMSPEQALGGSDQIGPASDIYSLGAVLYAALAGRPPIVAARTDELLLKVVSQPPTPLRELGLRVPRPLNNIIRQCLSKRPAQRYGSASELRRDLEAFLAGEPVRARTSSIIDNLDSYFRRHVLAATVSGTSVLLVLVLIVLVMLRTWAQSSYMVELQEENEQLQHLVALQNELMRGRANNNNVAIELANAGDADRAALFAALSLAAEEKIDEEADAELIEIVREYGQRHPVTKDVSGQAASEAEVDAATATLVNDTESFTELVQRIIHDFEQQQTAFLSQLRQ